MGHFLPIHSLQRALEVGKLISTLLNGLLRTDICGFGDMYSYVEGGGGGCKEGRSDRLRDEGLK